MYKDNELWSDYFCFNAASGDGFLKSQVQLGGFRCGVDGFVLVKTFWIQSIAQPVMWN